MAGTPALADDTEIYGGGTCTTTNTTTVPANVVFIIDTSGSMGWTVSGGQNTSASDPSRLNIVKGVFGNLINNLVNNNTRINAALMRFDAQGNSGNNSGGYFIKEMQEINATTSQNFIDAVNAMDAGSRTPLAETLYEATLYFLGSPVHFGNSTSPDTNVAGVLNGNNYISPISATSKNYVVYLTDGTPNQDGAADNLLTNSNLPGWNGGTCEFIEGNTGNEAADSDDCLDEIAYYLNHHDFNNANGQQNVTTYTIGFTTAQQLLQDAATNGGGQYFTTNTASGLANTLTQILQQITTSTVDVTYTRGTFIAPAVGIDAFNRTRDRNALYFTLFQSNNKAIWDGNIKAYKLGGDQLHLVDLNNQDVLDANGQFKTSSTSLWSSTADGDTIVNGGANAHIPAPASRTLYTKAANSEGALTDLAAAEPALFGISSGDATADNAARDAIVTTAKDSKLADPLHSQPVVVNYSSTAASPDVTLFVGANSGFLHAIDAISGVEKFAYAPKELLTSNVAKLGQPGSHLSGLDGSPTVWMVDTDHDGMVDSNEHAYLYIGMRKGGRNYYALDVANRSAPELKWVIEGGTGSFTELGETWSKPVLTTMMNDGAATKVLVFAGGYSSANTTGRAIYIVDATTGEQLWSADPSTTCTNNEACLTHSIPSNVRVFDSNMDGYADRLYVGDMGGHVFRVDFSDALSNADTNVTGGIRGSVTLLASLGGASPNDRRFFNAPDVVLTAGAPMYFSINIGSGDREHPKNNVTTEDRFYSIKDQHVHDSDFSSYTVVTEDTMLDVTTSNITGLSEKRGWYIKLATGEKVLAESLTTNNVTRFSTYVPPTTNLTACPPPIGHSRQYKVSLFHGTPAFDTNGDGTITAEDLGDDGQDGISGGEVLVFGTDSTQVFCDGYKCKEEDDITLINPAYWKQQ
jgi:type IV pilus assembly protein PilY1